MLSKKLAANVVSRRLSKAGVKDGVLAPNQTLRNTRDDSVQRKAHNVTLQKSAAGRALDGAVVEVRARAPYLRASSHRRAVSK